MKEALRPVLYVSCFVNQTDVRLSGNKRWCCLSICRSIELELCVSLLAMQTSVLYQFIGQAGRCFCQFLSPSELVLFVRYIVSR